MHVKLTVILLCRWLDEGEDDAAIERILVPSEGSKEKEEGELWKIWTTTGRCSENNRTTYNSTSTTHSFTMI